MRPPFFAALALGALALAPPADAAATFSVVTFSFTGVFDSSVQPPIAYGTPFSGSVTYELGIADGFPREPFVGFFANAVTAFRLEVGGIVVDSQSAPLTLSQLRVEGGDRISSRALWDINFNGAPVFASDDDRFRAVRM